MLVFVFDITNIFESDLQNAIDVLSETEKYRLENMISVKRRKEFILGHFLLRKVLCHFFNVDIEKARIESLQTGALHLPNMQGVFASISHTAEKLAIAIGKTPVGIDIEKMSPRDNFPGLLNQIDSMDVAKELVASGMSVQNAFYHLWCKKEALYKLNSQTTAQIPFLFYHRYKDFMMCVACKEEEPIEWIVKEIGDFNV